VGFFVIFQKSQGPLTIGDGQSGNILIPGPDNRGLGGAPYIGKTNPSCSHQSRRVASPTAHYRTTKLSMN
jgi:hypothetical protein